MRDNNLRRGHPVGSKNRHKGGFLVE